MSEDKFNDDRRSTRLTLSIPVFISAVDADGNDFSESVRTLIVNKHGGKIATTHHLALGTQVLVENLALGVVAKANVVWSSANHYPGDVHHVGLQLIEAQNVWGIAFPPDDWSFEPQDAASPASDHLPASEHANTVDAETNVTSLAGEEITIRLLQELQHSADAHALEFHDRLRQLTRRIGLELEFDLRERAAHAKAREVGALEEEIKTLKESLGASRQEMGELEARIQGMMGALPSATENPPPPSIPIQEARRQLSALANSVIESMNSAAVAGLSEYRNLLQMENQESAERLRRGAEEYPQPPKGPSPGS